MSAPPLPPGPGPLVPEGSGLAGLFEVAGAEPPTVYPASAPTPGPWHTDGDVVWAEIPAPGICMTVEPPVGVHFVERPEAERHANARQIAAAPELLAALRTLTAVYEREHYLIEQPCHPESALGIARAALAKAEGR